MSHGTFQVHNGQQVADFISWITPLWTMFGKDLTAVLSSGEGLDNQCSTWLLRDPHKCGTELSGVTEAVQGGLWPGSPIIILNAASMESLGLWEHGQVRRMGTKRTCSCHTCDSPLPK
jgi:hypothetical protein